MPYSFENKPHSSPEFDLSPGRIYTDEDIKKLSAGPDEPVVTAKKIELLDCAIKEGKEIKATFVTGKVIQGKFREIGALSGDYVCGDESLHKGDFQDIESIEIL